ncbi:MTH1187 family thiamine-binding protein [Metabacillus sp. 84]|uniref:MTH1187 family thiamine-binding protein n=1 Tax=unclassified Metabacillus TaxID=2675274 RepID=UPI003CE71480
MAVLELTITPVGTDDTSMRKNVELAVSIIREKGFNCDVTPLSTVIEGNADELFDLAKLVHSELLTQDGTDRLITSIKLDDRNDKKLNLDNQEKV